MSDQYSLGDNIKNVLFFDAEKYDNFVAQYYIIIKYIFKIIKIN